MKGNSIERDEEILNNIKAYMQENIDKGFHKFVYNDLGYDEKCVDVINAIEHILSDYKRVLKENKELQEDRDKFKKALGKRITYCNELEKDLFENGSNYVIPKSKVKEKIEELDKKRRKFTSDNVNNFYLQEFTRKYTQKSDHDYGVFSTPETITYCTNNELLGRIEALQDLLREE